MKDKVPLIFIALSLVVLVTVVWYFGPQGDEEPDPPDASPENGEDQQETEYDEFAGVVLFNGDELDLDMSLLHKGVVHLPLLEAAEKLGIEVSRDGNAIFLGPGEQVQESDSDPKVYMGGIDITPANVLEVNDEFYVDPREVFPLLGIYVYENLFADALHLVDDDLASRDGEYVVVGRRDQRGWAPELRMTVAGGAINAVEYGELDEDGQDKFLDQGYLENWRNANDIEPVELRDRLQSQLVETQDLVEVDVATGATGTWHNFARLAGSALGKAKVGALEEEFPDGNFVVLGAPDDRGWTPRIDLAVSGNRITEYRYDDINEDGQSKRDDEEYLENWRNAYPEVDPIAIVQEGEESIIKTQDPNIIDATTGATSWGINIKQYTTGALDQAARGDLPSDYDAIYVFCGPESERGDRPQLLLATVAGEIAAVDFSEYTQGVAKKYDEEYLASWREYAQVEPVEIVAEMEDIFLANQDPEELDAISGATGWRESFQNLAQRALDYLAKE